MAAKVCTAFRGGVIPEHKGHLPRVGHSGIIYHRDFYIFGGVNGKEQYSNHIYCHEKRSLQWVEVRGLGVTPTGRSNHTAVMHKSKMVVYGGHRNLQVFDDLYTFDFDNRRWDKIGYEKSQGPGPCFLHTAVYVPPLQSMIVLGGFHQREHNMYLGHTFDIRNRVWSGIPAPQHVNPQHIQLVSAAYHDPDSSVVVVGIAEEDSIFAKEMPPPSVYVMNVNTSVWKKVVTLSSPESPIPFRLDTAWDVLMKEHIMMGSFHDELQHDWYFPMNFEDPVTLLRRGSNGMRSKKRPTYGFLKLNLSDLAWSTILCSFPAKLVNEITVKNREKLSKQAIQSSMTPTGRQPSDPSEAFRRTAIPSKHLRHLPAMANYSSSGRTSVLAARSSRGPSFSSSNGCHGAQAFQKIMIYTVRDAPQFQRKYAYAIYRLQDPVRPKKKKPMEYVVMHGGLSISDDYTMIAFKPILTRPETNPATSQHLDESMSDFSDSHTSNYAWRSHRESGEFSAFSECESNALATLGSTVAESLDETGEGRILPVLPCCRSEQNMLRFAVLYHGRNSVKDQQLLAYPNIPVAVIETEKDVTRWSRNYYNDTRRWFSQQLTSALADDRQLRRARRRMARQSGAQFGLAVGGNDDSLDSSTDSDSEEAYPVPAAVNKERRSIVAASPDEVFAKPRNPHLAPMGNLSVEPTEDFFHRKGLDTFNVEEFIALEEHKNASEEAENDSERSAQLAPPGMGRLGYQIKRHAEMQRLPSSVFNSGSADANLGDLGSATAFVLMKNALGALRLDTSPESKHRQALIRWRFLRALVRTGEAAFLIYRATQESYKMKALRVTSAQGLLLAPELHLIGPTRTHKVPSRPIPYTLPSAPKLVTRYAELTKSGMVVYHNMRYVK